MAMRSKVSINTKETALSSQKLDVILKKSGNSYSSMAASRHRDVQRLNAALMRYSFLFFPFVVFVACTRNGDVQAGSGLIGPVEALIKWAPFILWGASGSLSGFVLNIAISFLAMAIATVTGAFLGLMQISLLAPVRASSWIVTQFFRNSPWLVLLFTIMLLVPFEIDLGFATFPVPAWIKAVIGFSLPVMANISEVVRGAVRSIPTGQWESAESLAFNRRQTLWMIILPQCIKRMIPPWINWYCILTMATPLCSIMGVEEGVKFTSQVLAAEGDRPELLPIFYLFLLALFFVYTYPIALCSKYLEKRFGINA